ETSRRFSVCPSGAGGEAATQALATQPARSARRTRRRRPGDALPFTSSPLPRRACGSRGAALVPLLQYRRRRPTILACAPARLDACGRGIGRDVCLSCSGFASVSPWRPRVHPPAPSVHAMTGNLSPLIAILRGIEPREAVAVADLLLQQGFTTLEVPLNSPEPLESIRLIAGRFGDRALVGAGTVLDAAAARAVAEACGRLVVMPHGDPAAMR